jgi:NAD(P)-dependent dehydrogenase (short-subunit alcohol dehydrogenase family)
MSDTAQVVLVTGANQGLGYEVALQLAKLPGYHVLVGARSQEKGAEAVSKIQAAEGVVSKLEPILVDLDSDETIHDGRIQVWQARRSCCECTITSRSASYISVADDPANWNRTTLRSLWT